MARMRHKMRQKRAKTPAAKHRRVRGGQQTRLDATGQGHIDPVDRVLMSKKQLGKRRVVAKEDNLKKNSPSLLLEKYFPTFAEDICQLQSLLGYVPELCIYICPDWTRLLELLVQTARSNPHANISLSNKKRKKLLKLMAHQQRDELRKKGLAEEAENLETSLLFGNEDDEEDSPTTTDHQSGEMSTKMAANDDEVAEMEEI